MRGLGLTLTIVSLLTAVPLAADAEQEEYPVDGLYAGLSAALGGVADDKVNDTPVAGGFQLHGGVRVSFLAAEVEFEWLDNLVDRVSNPDPGRRSDVDAWTLTGNAKLYAPRWRNGDFYVLGGVGMIRREVESSSSQDDEAFAWRAGLGVELWLTQHVLATFEAGYVRPVGGLHKLEYVSGGVGLQYRF